LVLEEDYDPDTLLGITQSYAGQVSLFDTCIGALSDFIAESPLAEDTLLAIVAPRGYPLGEHRRVGPCQTDAGDEALQSDLLHGELLHVPLMIRFPVGQDGAGLGKAARSQALVTPADLGPTLLDWWGQSTDDLPGKGQFATSRSLLPLVRGESEGVRDRICTADADDGRGIRVPAWYLRMQDGDSLYAKPDDRWEFNNVADRCGEVVKSLHKVADEFEQHMQADQPGDLPALDDVLIHGLE
ncbi:MAG: sulfatase-like hydrolase/transferase, partial [Planctomycetota bacterium]|nr:sulfatase-like hydrolase/transferase [Planctomycetota bacterium]